MINLIEISQGNSRILKFGPVTDPVSKAPVDMNGGRAVWRLARSPNSTNSTDIFLRKTTEDVVNPIQIINSNGSEWFLWVRLLASETAVIPPSINPARWWWHELMITDQFHNVDTAYRGGIIIHPSIDLL